MSGPDNYYQNDSFSNFVDDEPEQLEPEVVPALESVRSIDELGFTDIWLRLNLHPQNTDFYFSGNGKDVGKSTLEQVPAEYHPDLRAIMGIILDFHKDHGGFPYERSFYRFEKMSTVNSEEWVSLRKFNEPPEIDGIRANPDAVRILKSWNRRAGGIIIVSGSTNAGKTTTAVALLSHFLETDGGKAIAIQDAAELPLHGAYGKSGRVLEAVIEPTELGTYIYKSLRMSPKYIFIGEVRYPIVAAEALRASLTGRTIITTLHAGRIDEAISRFTSMATATGQYSDEYARQELGKSLIGIVSQRLSPWGPDMDIAFPANDQERQKFAQMIEDHQESAISKLGWAKNFQAIRPTMRR